MRLSIIIACYNASAYLKRTVESIFKGGYFTSKQIEIIAINDGSSDDTWEVLNALAQKYPIQLINQENRGVGVTKNKGLETAKGQYVLILDADDWIDAQVVSESLNYAIDNGLDLMAFGMQYVNENYEYTHLKNIFPGPYNTVLTGAQVLKNGYQPSSVCLFLMHQRFFKEERMRFYEGTQLDVEISTRLMLKASQVYFTPKIGYYYYRNEGSITKAVNQEKLKSYLFDAVRIAILGKENTKQISDEALKKILVQNNNSTIWNLIWRFVRYPKEVDYEFKIHCLQEMKKKDLYPIKGDLKTTFQKVSTLFFNREFFLKIFMSFTS
jgi:glycosyltransferase involved in cell wall biosynthesis